MKRLAVLSLASVLLAAFAACVSDQSGSPVIVENDGGGGGGDTDGATSGSADGATAGDAGGGAKDAGPSCAVGCSDPDTVRACPTGAGGTPQDTKCTLGCSTFDGGPHCAAFFPTAPVTTGDLTTANVTAFTFPSGVTIVNPDTGQMTGAVTRAANTVSTTVEVSGNGIAFHQDGMGTGIFAFGDLTISAGATVGVVGSNAVAFVSSGKAVVDGTVDLRPMSTNGSNMLYLCPPGYPNLAAPGGGQGGLAGYPGGPTVQPKAGTGLGPGGPGTASMSGGGGGGGGGHGSTGGKGGGTCGGTAAVIDQGGAMGVAYTSGLKGGSGGGGGFTKNTESSSGAGRGGAGGGAIQIVAAGSITIGDGTAVEGINAGGCGGYASSINNTVPGTGGGGGSGGMIFLESPFVELRAMAVLAANGGGGAGIAIGSSGKAAQLDGQPAAGGGAVDAGTPGNGAAGDSPTGVSPTVACGFQEGLGAGGAAGRIVINTKSGTPTLNATSIVSPSIKSSAASFGKADLH